ncbi:MAG: hypothetical protein J6Q51_00010, partial [Clostridia bacterium]|nr:hypothetical protein [Clostridia bacterium]
MKHYTGNGGSEEINMYQIPNIGKLNQMCGVEGGTKYYNLVKDIDGSYITNEDEGCKEALRWNSKSISDVVFIGTGISGSANAPTIKNVITQKGGLFDKVENSRIGQINLERFNIRSTKADDSNTKDSIFGILANKSINSTISDIYIEQPVDFLQAISSFGSKVENVKFGFVVGKVGNGKEDSSVISNCNVVLTKTSTVNVLEIPESERNWSIGGTIGVLAGGTATNLKLSDSELYIDFAETDARSNKTYVVGGIVAEQTGGVITKSIFNSKLYAFTNEVNVWSGDLSKPINLYVGGIVGKVEQGMNSYAVEECLTQQVSGISAGNHYSFTTVYAGGISGHGGKILNCKNMASVAAYAVYTYGSSYNSMTERYLSNSYTETLEKASWGYKGWKNSDVDADTRNSSSKGYRYKMFNKGEPGINLNSFTKILYAEIKQDAHAAGIANEYELIENCLNTSKSIKGGTKSETLHSYYHPEKSNDEINKKIWNLNLKVVLMDAYLALYAVGIK